MSKSELDCNETLAELERSGQYSKLHELRVKMATKSKEWREIYDIAKEIGAGVCECPVCRTCSIDKEADEYGPGSFSYSGKQVCDECKIADAFGASYKAFIDAGSFMTLGFEHPEIIEQWKQLAHGILSIPSGGTEHGAMWKYKDGWYK